MRFILTAAFVAILAACTEANVPELKVDSIEVRLSPVTGRPATAYFDLGAVHGPSRLLRITSPRSGRIEMHETVSDGRVSRMAPIPHADLDDNGVTFEPGGKHAMLFDLAGDVRPGGTIPITFHYEAYPVGGDRVVPGTLTVQAPVRSIGDPLHAGH